MVRGSMELSALRPLQTCFGDIIGGQAVKARPVTLSNRNMWSVAVALQGHQVLSDLDAEDRR